MKFGSLFAGIGGFDLGFENVGMTSEFQVEIDPRCGELLGKRFQGVPLHTDITGVQSDWFTDIDLLCGGFPCQDISNAGKRAGLAGGRSGLWWEYHRLLEGVRPEWCVIENVAGLLSSGGRRDLGAILGALGNLGYGFAYRVLDSQWFGVPQRRRRVFIVGRLGDWRAPAKVLLEPEGLRGNPAPGREEGKVPAALTATGVGTCGADDNQAQAGHLIPGVVPALTTRCGSTYDDQQTLQLVPMTVGLGSDVIHATDLAQPVTGRNGDPGVVVSFAENQRAEVVTAPVTPALSTGGGKPGMGYPAIHTDTTVRRLTPTECERLQGFPDGWTEGFADTARYKMLGNAVTVPVVEWIGRRIMEQA